ncbi:MAG: flagellar basal body L-ring protein FlgH [Steroidobacteraceae bacterium]
MSELEITGLYPASLTVPRAVSRSALLISAFALLSACVSAPHIDDFAASWPDEPESSVASNGAIFQAGHDIALFENAIARRVGDTVTIHLVEKTNASKSSSTTTSKTSTADMSAPTIAGLPVTVNGTEVLKMGVDNQTAFDGSGDSSQSNRLEGDITVTVARRLANGNLLVRGQKWIAINQGKEYVRIQGIIRPVDIAPDNSVPSSKVADALISYGGQGVLADANSKGWLMRFFDKPWAPF